MAVVNFTLSEEGVAVLHDALVCIQKFSDDVSLEVRKEKLVLTALNLTKSAYISFTFAANRFFSRYSFEGNAQYRERFFCILYIRALLSVFRSRTAGGDPSRDRERESTIERCDVAIEDGPGKKSRLIAKIVTRNGITATHRLPFEIKPPVHAKFNQDEAVHHWAISSRTLRQLMDHFGPGIELLDINTEGENVVNFTCFNETPINLNNETVLKKPLHTSIAVDMDEFDDVQVEEKLHIIISVKDFRAILQHAGLTSGTLSASYSRPGRPLKLAYNGDGIICEFILMTVGEKGTAAQKKLKGRVNGAKAARPALEAASSRGVSVATENRPQSEAPQEQPPKVPPPRSSIARHSQFEMRPPPIQPPSTLRSESLFMPQDDDDQQWEPMNQEEDADEGENARLEWDASNQPNTSTIRISDHLGTQSEAAQQNDTVDSIPSGLEPTQRLSEVRRFGLFSG
ncbi:DNA repair protein rad9 [Pleurostoma richardsiae]|uniref:DNA repair protein rad9 n=1 Tax=Pleurostoma richardsiae TaxID=41990 RepID=A0AA38S9E3_9PEZI|nr:DNA repair protein rad9 [Pleurostoma richardsiae]